MKRHFFTFLVVFIGFSQLGNAQPTNTNCGTAFIIADPIDYCSSFGEFNNINAGPGNPNVGTPNCWNDSNNDVWFRFISFARAINVTVSGNANGQMTGGTLVQPEVALYIDDGCQTYQQLRCDSDTQNDGATTIFRGDLTIGQSYLVRVGGRANTTGTFTICTRNFNPPQEPEQDCNLGSVLCDKSPFIVQSVIGAGVDNTEFGSIPCGTDEQGQVTNLVEDQSTWFQWTCDMPGTLTFILDPILPGDDLDWALYELPSGISNCGDKVHLRCAFNSPTNPDNCGDLTGMNDTDTEISEDFNCESNENGFVQSIVMQSGVSYALGISNFTSSGVGFEIEFGGTGTFQGPEAMFTIDPDEGLRCDTFFTVENFSSFINGTIVSYDWNFGEGAVPATADTEGPHQVIYNSFGDKFITLTIESDQGCIITEVLPLFAEPCCDDLTDIEIQLIDVQDLVCATIPDGSIEVAGANGTPQYQFSLDDSDFFPVTVFAGLDAGNYEIKIQDIKGCTDSVEVAITSPPELVVDAGPDVTVDLCFETQFSGSYAPVGVMDSISWNAQDTSDNNSLSCLDCLDPIAIAPGQTTYTLTVIDEVGCSASDEVTVFVEEDYPIYGPNIFTPNGDGFNDRFTLYGGPAAIIIREFYIYDRWGELIFYKEDVPLNDPDLGWNGDFKSDDLGTQVFSWFALIEFCDSDGPDDTRPYSGDITLIKG